MVVLSRNGPNCHLFYCYRNAIHHPLSRRTKLQTYLDLVRPAAHFHQDTQGTDKTGILSFVSRRGIRRHFMPIRKSFDFFVFNRGVNLR